MTTAPQPRLQSNRFLLLYALAAAGGAISYTPFLTLLLPLRMFALAGAGDIVWLAYATFFGAVAASLANIAFGWISDWSGVRKPWILAGLLLSSLLLPAFAEVGEIRALIVLLVLWQVAVNMMLAPLAAWAGDCVPDNQKGRLGGLLSFSPALGALSAALVTLPGLAGPEGRLWLVAGLVVACVLPVLAVGQPRPLPELMDGAEALDGKVDAPSGQAQAPVVLMWVARLLMQVSEAALFAYLYFWFRTVDPVMTDARVAQVFSVVLLLSVPIALIAGHWADRSGKPFLPLPITAAISAVGLLFMAMSASLAMALAGYVLFGLAVSVFLALHSGQTLRLLPRPGTRGRDLGLFNLTNTVPSIVMPWLALALVPLSGFAGLFVALAVCAGLACLVLLAIFPRK